ncbi:MAG: MGMT family protein [Mangrovibacterium sp.]
MSDIFEMAYEVARHIPKGRVTSYGAIARCIGSARSARMVGWAMNKAPFQERYVPAHRVVNAKGLLTGKMHFHGKSMEELLEAEGIEIKNNQIQHFDEVFWNPMEELGREL